MNRIAIKKNRIENGIFAGLKKLNPHSKGVDFSRQFLVFFENIVIKRIKTILSIKVDKTREKIIIIKSYKFLDFLQSSALLLERIFFIQ